MKNKEELRQYLDSAVKQFNVPGFIADDPISIPHQFSRKQDIEIIGFLAATLAWGQRITIINNCNRLIQLMDKAPYDFILNHKEKDRAAFLDFKHRTFQSIDTLYFLEFLQQHYKHSNSLETAFTLGHDIHAESTEGALRCFHDYFFSLEFAPQRTRKHVSTPKRKSACKRLNMFLRWMVRKDDKGVDFGIWNTIKPHQLQMPLDVHVARVASSLGLLKRKQRDWQAVVELTNELRKFDPQDPVKYDFALFGLGILEKSQFKIKTKKRPQ